VIASTEDRNGRANVRRSRLAAAFLVFSTYMIAHGLHLRLHGFCLVGPAPSKLADCNATAEVRSHCE
jgi:hypothetical protein